MSLSAAVLDALVASGATQEMLVAAMKADIAVREAEEAARLETKRQSNRDRQQRKRERDRNASSRVTPVTARDERDQPSPNESILTPTRETKTEAKASSKSLVAEKIQAVGTCLKVAFVLPDDIPAEPWARWLEARTRIRKPPTDHAKALAVTELRRLRDEEGWPPGDVLNHCTMNSYQGIYPPKRDKPNGRSQQASLSKVVHRILGDGGIDRGAGEDAGPGSSNLDERGATRALAARGG